MMRIAALTLIIFLVPAHSALGTEVPQAFPGLKIIEVADSNLFKIRVYYDPSISKVVYEEVEGGYWPRMTRILETKLDRNGGPWYSIGYTGGMSADPTFLIAPKGTPDQHVGNIPGIELVLPGNGSVYVAGHTNNYFNQRSKYVPKNGKLVEVKQPFNYVGLDSKALKDITIFSDKKLSQAVAKIPAGTKLTVLLNDGDHYLLKTQFGLVGWIHYRPQQLGADLIDGLYFLGD